MTLGMKSEELDEPVRWTDLRCGLDERDEVPDRDGSLTYPEDREERP